MDKFLNMAQNLVSFSLKYSFTLFMIQQLYRIMKANQFGSRTTATSAMMHKVAGLIWGSRFSCGGEKRPHYGTPGGLNKPLVLHSPLVRIKP